MKKITLKSMRAYFNENNLTLRHDLHSMKKSLNTLSREVCIDAYDLFLLVVENKPIEGGYTHSYGFHTGTGRHLIDTFSNYYYEFKTLK